jgi:hypothetical protein
MHPDESVAFSVLDRATAATVAAESAAGQQQDHDDNEQDREHCGYRVAVELVRASVPPLPGSVAAGNGVGVLIHDVLRRALGMLNSVNHRRARNQRVQGAPSIAARRPGALVAGG